MFNLIQQLKRKLRKDPTEADIKLGLLRDAIRVSDSHLVAIARLMFIKPSVLIREAYNVKANGEYLLELLEEQKKLFEPEVKEEVKKKK